MRGRVLAGLGVVALLGAALGPGCAELAGLGDDRSLATPTASTTTAPAGGGAGHGGAAATSLDASAGGAPGCALATYPAPPPGADGSGDREIVVALRALDLGDQGAVVGLDLDGKCTCQGDGPSCRRPAWIDADLCDAKGGRDAQSAKLFTLINPATSGDVSSKSFTNGMALGTWSVLLRVTGYNGLPDDPRVAVALFPSTGIAWALRPPKWDGTDVWPVAETAIADGGSGVDSPRYVDTHAYVAGGRLVASMPVSELIVGDTSAHMRMRLTAAFFTAKVAGSGDGFTLLDGTIAARWKLEDMFEFVRSLRLKSGPMCKDDPLYPTLKARLCGSLDIFSGVSTPTTACDSMSLGVSFTASPAKLGPPAPLPAASPGCPDATDPLGDTCP